MARINRCSRCSYFCHKPPMGEKWGTYCLAPAVGQPLQVQALNGVLPDALLLDDATMEGPVSTCPKGYWNVLVPVDIPAMQQTARDKAISIEGPKLRRVMDAIIPGATPTELQEAAARLVADGCAKADIAAEAVSGPSVSP